MFECCCTCLLLLFSLSFFTVYSAIYIYIRVCVRVYKIVLWVVGHGMFECCMPLQYLSGIVSLFFVPSECHDFVVFVDNAPQCCIFIFLFLRYIYIITIIIIRI